MGGLDIPAKENIPARLNTAKSSGGCRIQYRSRNTSEKQLANGKSMHASKMQKCNGSCKSYFSIWLISTMPRTLLLKKEIAQNYVRESLIICV